LNSIFKSQVRSVISGGVRVNPLANPTPEKIRIAPNTIAVLEYMMNSY
jgi:hypothetical protein